MLKLLKYFVNIFSKKNTDLNTSNISNDPIDVQDLLNMNEEDSTLLDEMHPATNEHAVVVVDDVACHMYLFSSDQSMRSVWVDNVVKAPDDMLSQESRLIHGKSPANPAPYCKSIYPSVDLNNLRFVWSMDGNSVLLVSKHNLPLALIAKDCEIGFSSAAKQDSIFAKVLEPNTKLLKEFII